MDWTGVIVIGGAIVTWPLTTWILINFEAEGEAKRRRSDRFIGQLHQNDPLVDGEDYGFAAFIGFLSALIWPAAWLFGIGFLIYALLPSTNIFTPRAERQRLKEQELRELRRKVKEYEIKGGEEL